MTNSSKIPHQGKGDDIPPGSAHLVILFNLKFIAMKILAIKSITTKAGRPMILVQTAEKDLFITVKQWQSKGCSSILDSYVGGDIEADYYQEGDKMINDTVCTKNDTVLRDFSVSVNPVVSARALAAESELRMSNALNASALFARNKADKTVEANGLQN